MSSRSLESPPRRVRWVALALTAASAAAVAALPGSPMKGPLRICADPDNAPFSTAARTGFENRLAALLGEALGVEVQYYWWPQRRGFLRNTLGAGVCDVVMGLPAGSADVLTTAPYYEAGYVFAYRADRIAPLRSYDDPRLRTLRVGVPLVGNDMAETPPGHALARRAITDQVIGFTPFGQSSVAERMMAGLADGSLDVALLWAPQAAWFAARQDFAVTLTPAVDPQAREPQAFAMAIGVPPDQPGLRSELDAALSRIAPKVDALLREFGLPRATPAVRVSQSPAMSRAVARSGP